MSQKRRIRHHLRQLGEIRDIMNAMKNLAFFETRKLARALQNQQQMVEELEWIAADFLQHYPYPATGLLPQQTIWVLFGSERGFCGEFNEELLHYIQDRQENYQDCHPDAPRPLLLPVGHKLISRLEQDPRVSQLLDGADVAEEITPVLTTLVTHLTALLSKRPGQVLALFHHSDSGRLTERQLMPPFQNLSSSVTANSPPPVLNLPPATFFHALVDHYLFIALHEIAYQSLMSENTQRIEHMTRAIRRLEERQEELLRQYHRYRQEEITEEIEVILLNAGGRPEPQSGNSGEHSG